MDASHKRVSGGYYHPLEKESKQCFYCGSEFESQYCWQKYCCYDCRKNAWGQKYRDPEYLAQRKANNTWLALRFHIFHRDNFTCQYCGRSPVSDGVILEVDHIDRNAGSKEENLKTACRECNQGKRGDWCLGQFQVIRAWAAMKKE